MAQDPPWMQPKKADNQFLTSALHYAGLGLEVLPCRPGTKMPLTAHGFHDATTDENQIRAWWQATPTANVACRPRNVGLVLDVDPRNGGDVGIANWATDHGEVDAAVCETGGGGRHIWFRCDPAKNIKYGQGERYVGIDVISATGYVMMPPSIHPSGDEYQWLDDDGLMPIVDRLPSTFVTATAAPATATAVRNTQHSLTAAPVVQLADVRGALAALNPDCLYMNWVTVGQALHSQCWTESFDLWNEWSAGGAKYPGERELRHKWSTFNPDGQVGLGTLFHMARQQGYNGTRPLSDKPTHYPPDVEPAAAVSPVNLAGLGSSQPPSRHWVFHDWVPANSTTLFHSQGGLGKTRVALQMSVCLVLAQNKMGIEPGINGPVAFLSAEEDDESLRIILHEICVGYALSREECKRVAEGIVCIDLVGSNPELYGPVTYDVCGWTKLAEGVRAAVQAAGCVFGIMDNASACYGGPETSKPDVYSFVNGFKSWFPKLGGAMIISHDNKASATSRDNTHAYSGITAWHNACRGRLHLTKEEGSDAERTLTRPKQNYAAADGAGVPLIWQSGAFLHNPRDGLVAQARVKAERRKVLDVLEQCMNAYDYVSPANNSPAYAWTLAEGLSLDLDGISKRRFGSVLAGLLRDQIEVKVGDYVGEDRHRRKAIVRCNNAV